MESNRNIPALKDIVLDKNLVPYLQLSGWKEDTSANVRWIVFHRDIETDHLEIVLPRNNQSYDLKIYTRNTVELLSAISSENIEDTVQRIVYFDSDVLHSRDLQTGEYNSITLRMAAQQVTQLKQLVNYSTFSEQQPKPHFLQSETTLSKQMIEHYRFGHTFEGSFGFKILSPIIHLPSPYIQPNLFGEAPPDPMTPIERRVMERIIRGLSITKQAVRSNDPQLLIQEYASGFNGNMCQAIVKMSQDKTMQIEYKVFWSPKIKPAEDMQDEEPLGLSEISYDYLEYAATELKKLKPEYVTVKGRIVGLTSKDNPLGASAHRSVVIRGRFNENSTRRVDILVELNKEDYIKASQAHLEWDVIEVNGVLSRSGYGWRLTDATDFKIQSGKE
jgi:hypothetical protein